ncbi:hypothetical protein [Alienimonas californiensis]|uniref:hypothetical protein n=1 Tax=Alienimonas californiensis TaxID=2527989 RepID=UPI0036F2C04B
MTGADVTGADVTGADVTGADVTGGAVTGGAATTGGELGFAVAGGTFGVATPTCASAVPPVAVRAVSDATASDRAVTTSDVVPGGEQGSDRMNIGRSGSEGLIGTGQSRHRRGTDKKPRPPSDFSEEGERSAGAGPSGLQERVKPLRYGTSRGRSVFSASRSRSTPVKEDRCCPP